MKKLQGYPLPLGVTVTESEVNFSIAVDKNQSCRLLLYKPGTALPDKTYELTEGQAAGEVRYLSLQGLEADAYEYNYEIDDKVVVDPYVKSISGRDIWGEPRSVQNHEVRGRILFDSYDWEGDHPLLIPYNEVIAYSLHVRGFTKSSTSKVVHKGTFLGVIEKIPYLKELGINQIQCMPVYEFEECKQQYRNYWGYGDAFCFAPKASYASGNDAVAELKDMIKECHRSGIEVILYLPFTGKVPYLMMIECLRYYAMEYHVDGFILDSFSVPIQAVLQDPVLKSLKIMQRQDTFQNTMRRFLKGDEGMVRDVMWWLRHHSKEDGIFNYVASHNGFTLADVVSYDGKHNELNGENNQDGPDYNFSWNCGAEGPSRKKTVVALRKKQVRNAFFLLLSAQGTPCILAGDEFGNSQKGNNNVYCQDNEIGWVNWNKLEREEELFDFVKQIITLRKQHPILHPSQELLGMDQRSCGVPDVSYHGESAWQVPAEISSRQLGVYYCGECANDEDCFIAYNMHWIKHSFALPSLNKGKQWYRVLSTLEGLLDEPVLVENKKEVMVDERTIIFFIGR